MPSDQRSLIHQEAWFPPCFERQNQQKKNVFFGAGILDHFQTIMFQSETTSFYYFSPRIPNIGHPTSGSGGKKTFKRYLKVNRHTDKHTDRRTFRPLKSIDPEGRCFENMLHGKCITRYI